VAAVKEDIGIAGDKGVTNRNGTTVPVPLSPFLYAFSGRRQEAL
jgi:hypothetical protein